LKFTASLLKERPFETAADIDQLFEQKSSQSVTKILQTIQSQKSSSEISKLMQITLKIDDSPSKTKQDEKPTARKSILT